MRSGTGRHRRPRQAPAIFVTAGVTGAGFAMPLLAASGAQAADTATWDRVAECESDSQWSANDDSGYYGGLQLTQSTWEDFGGTDYAERPDLASRSQQIAVAEKILAQEGPDAWPRCAVSSGLTEDSTEKPDVNPGELLTPSPTPTPTPDPSDSGSESESGADRPAGDGSESDGGAGNDGEQGGTTDDGEPEADDPSDDPSDGASGGGSESGGPGGDDSADGDQDQGERAGTEPPEAGEGTGKHRGKPDPREREGELEGERGAGSPGRDGDRAGGEAGDYLVRAGDSLSRIAERRDVEGGWASIYAENESVIGADPDLILPGQRLDLGDGQGE